MAVTPTSIAAAKHVATRNILNPLLWLCALISAPAAAAAAFAPTATLTGSFMEFFGGKVQHVLVPAIGAQTGGILPQYIWDWLNRQDLPALGGLLGQFLTPPPNN